jgi:serine/alanine adding enzyme
MNIHFCKTEADREKWDAFVETHPDGTKFHLWNWRNVIENSFGWQTFNVMAVEGANIRGILPLAWKKSRLFGSFVSSLPFISGGGVLATDHEAEKFLIDEAIRLTRELKADYLELRHREDHRLDLPTQSNRVTVLVPLNPDPEKMWASLDSRVRTSIRKSMKSGLAAQYGGEELVDEFYAVFAENMRDLGTPVYSQRFFLEILRGFPGKAEICVVRHGGKAVAAAFLNGYRGVIEPQWAASTRRSLALKPNMFLHWNVICHAAELSFRVLDFGRSWVDSGAYDYKMKWGGKAVPLHWSYWRPEGDHSNSVSRRDPKFQMFIRAWQKLPLPLTTMIGPRLVRYFPS